jgi:hypothetical protein
LLYVKSILVLLLAASTLSIFQAPAATAQNSAAGLTADIPPFNVAPGSSQTQEIVIRWSGTTNMVIHSITFAENPEWFTLGTTLPYPVKLYPGMSALETTIPLTVTIPPGVSGEQKTIPVRITASSVLGTETVEAPVMINHAGSPLGLYVLGGAMVATIVGAWIISRRR